jgi:hypothetical protein
MIKMEQPLNFPTAEARSNWIKANATYWTAFRYLGRKRQREEAPTLEEARIKANRMLAENDIKPVLIYAVCGISDTFVEMVLPGSFW